MTDRIFNVLFLCTGNSARSVMAEALLNVLGHGRFRAFSAGSFPSGKIQPLAAKLATELGYPADSLRSKSWDEFAQADAPPMDLIITVCDNAAGEICPVWPGHPATAHWGVADPAEHPDDLSGFMDAWSILRRRVELLIALPMEKLDALALQMQARDIGRMGVA